MRKILRTKRHYGNATLLRERGRCPPRYVALIIMTIAFISLPQIARAVNEPVLRSTSPARNAVVRSSTIDVVTATFDRDLSRSSTMSVHNNVPSDPDEPGTVALAGPQSESMGYRAVAFYPSTTFSESVSPYTVTVVACPVVGGCSTISFPFSIDDTPPPQPVVTVPAPGEVRNEQLVVASGSAEAGVRIEIREASVVIVEATAHTNGDWATQLPYPPADGIQHTIHVFAIDRAGNYSPPTTRTFVHDSIQQKPYIATPAQNQAVGSTAVVVSGIAKPASTVSVYEGNVLMGSTVAGGNQNWSATITFPPGTHVITATSTDEWGTVDGPSEARTFVVDTTAPAAPVIITPAAGAFVPATDVEITGTAEPNATVRIRESSVVRGSAQTDAAGAWTVILGFTDGAHSITAEAVDPAGNVGPSVARAFTVDSVAPPPPSILTPAQHAFLNSSTVTVGGTAEPGATIELFMEANPAGTTTVGGGGAWSITITLADGAHSATAIAVDAAGNEGPLSEARVFAVDTVVPLPPVITSPVNGATFATANVTITGTAEHSTIIRIIESSVVIGTTGAGSDGNWSITLPFANGSYSVTATSSDAATNTSPPSAPVAFSVNVTSDGTPPAAPVITAPGAGSLQRADVVVAGTAEPGTVVRVIEGAATIGTMSASPDGTWSRLITFTTGGSHTIFATATDAAGNASGPSASRTFSVDIERPDVAFSPAQPILLVPPLVPIVIAGTASDNVGVDRVELEIDQRIGGARVLNWTADSCSGCPGSSVAWQATPPLLPGVYLVNAYAVDVAGNRSVGVQITIVVL